MLALILKTISVNLKKLIIFSSISILFIWMMVALFGSLEGQAEEFSKLIELYPEAMLDMMGIEAESLFSSFGGFLAAEFFSMIWPIMIITLIFGIGTSTIAGEIDNRSIESLLALPLSRAKIFLAKYIGGLFIVLSFIFFSVFPIIPFLLIYDIDFKINNYFAIFGICSLAGFAIHSFIFMISSVSSSAGKASSLGLVSIIAMYAINLVSSLQSSLEDIKYLSFFHYFDYNSALINGEIEVLNIIVFIYFGLMFSFLGLVFFVKRDIAT